MSVQNDFDTTASPSIERRYWLQALADEVRAVWGEHPIYKAAEHIEELSYYAFLTTFYDADRADIRNRRRSLYFYAKGPFETAKATDSLNVHAHKLPIDSFIPKVIDNLCIVYSEAPERAWLNAAGATDDGATAILKGIYRDGGFDGQLMEGHGYAKLCTGALVRPLINEHGRWELQILPPDSYRARASGDVLTAVTIPTERVEINPKGEEVASTVFENWTKDVYFETDYRGKRIPMEDVDAETGKTVAVYEKPNPYGRVPYSIMRLVKPTNGALLSGGLFATVEAALVCNLIRFAMDQSAIMESWGMWVAVNLYLRQNGIAQMGWGQVLDVVDVEGGQDKAPPDLSHVTPGGQYQALDELVDRIQRRAMRLLGLPESVISELAGTPSGLARYLERLPLIKQRKRDINHLSRFERDLSDLVIATYNVDMARPNALPDLDARLTLSVDFAEEQFVEEASARFAGAVRELVTGAMPPSRFVREVMGIDTPMTDDEAIAYVIENQQRVMAIAQTLATAAGVSYIAPATQSDSGGEGGATAQLRGSVGGAQAIAALQEKYYSNVIPRTALVNLMQEVFGFSQASAERLFPEQAPDSPAETAAPTDAIQTDTTPGAALPGQVLDTANPLQ